jgi:hypothetical protein
MCTSRCCKNDHAKSVSYDDFKVIDLAERPYRFTVWRLLNNVSIDVLLRSTLPAISLPVQQMITKDVWTLEDLLSLPRLEQDERPGVYILLPTGSLIITPSIGCEAYVGVPKHLHTRIYKDSSSHTRISLRYEVKNLPKNKRGSLLYQNSCRGNVRLNPRRLAVYDQTSNITYQYMLEGVCMILVGTYQNPGYIHSQSSLSSSELAAKIRATLDLPEVLWRSLDPLTSAPRYG